MEIQVGNKIQEVTLLSKEGNKVSISIDGKVYDVDIAMLQNGTCSLIYGGNSYNAELIKGEGGKHYTVNLNYSAYQIDILDSQAKYMRMRKHQDAIQADRHRSFVGFPPQPAGAVIQYFDDFLYGRSNLAASDHCRLLPFRDDLNINFHGKYVPFRY